MRITREVKMTTRFVLLLAMAVFFAMAEGCAPFEESSWTGGDSSNNGSSEPDFTYDEECENVGYSPCENPGERRCGSFGIEICVWRDLDREDGLVPSSVLVWCEEESCVDLGLVCEYVDGEPACVCLSKCTVEGEKDCIGERIYICEVMNDGCLDWVAKEECADSGQFCNENGECEDCNHFCLNKECGYNEICGVSCGLCEDLSEICFNGRCTSGAVDLLNSPAQKNDPDIDGYWIVWSEKRSTDYDIYAYNLSDGEERLICGAEGNQNTPAISGDWVVWSDCRADGGDIYAYNMASGEESPICVLEGYQRSPSISGDTIAWIHNAQGGANSATAVMVYSLSSKTTTTVCDNEFMKYGAVVDGDWVIWVERRPGSDADIFGRNLKTGEERTICDAEGIQHKVQKSGDLVVWEDSRSGRSFDIYLYNLSTGNEHSVYSSYSNSYSPMIAGDQLVWAQSAQSNEEWYFEIKQLNVGLSSIPRTIATTTSINHDLTMSDRIVAWKDRIGDADRIYVYAGLD
jgi:beta propeller repeat protein